MDELIAAVNEARHLKGFFTLQEVMQLTDRKNVIFDPWSTLISTRADIGEGNTFFPNTMIDIVEDGTITIGNENVFESGAVLVSAANGKIAIGDGNLFGEGSFAAKANRVDSLIVIKSHGRYLGGTKVMGRTSLGDGCQVIGLITVQDCMLSDGEDYRHPDPDSRGGLLKGHGLARGLTVERGRVINGSGRFSQEALERQSSYH